MKKEEKFNTKSKIILALIYLISFIGGFIGVIIFGSHVLFDNVMIFVLITGTLLFTIITLLVFMVNIIIIIEEENKK